MIYQVRAKSLLQIYFCAALNLPAIPQEICSSQKPLLAHALWIAELSSNMGLFEAGSWVPTQLSSLWAGVEASAPASSELSAGGKQESEG